MTTDHNVVPTPMFISARLMAALKIDGAGTIHLEVTDASDRRVHYRYIIEDTEGTVLDEGDDLSTYGQNYVEAMSSVLSFLTAAAESYRYGSMGDPDAEKGENEDLFSPACVEWAYQNSDELTMARMELDGDGGD